MSETRATTIRFAEPMYERLEAAAGQTGLTINAIVVVACLEWLDQHMVQPVATPRVGWGPLTSEVASGPAWHTMFRGRRRSSNPRHFDQLTARARSVMSIASEEAAAAGRPISPEFLLLALAVEGEGLAAHAISDAGTSTDSLRLRASSVGAAFGVSRQPTADLKRAIEAAFDEAKQRRHGHIGTEHLLLGLLRDERFADIAAPLRSALARVMAEAYRTGEADADTR